MYYAYHIHQVQTQGLLRRLIGSKIPELAHPLQIVCTDETLVNLFFRFLFQVWFHNVPIGWSYLVLDEILRTQ